MSANTQTIDERLKLIIRSFYEAASFAREIGQKEEQKKSMLVIQDQMQRDRMITTNSNNERLSESITEIQLALRSLQTKLKESEAKAVRLLQDAINERLKEAYEDTMKRRDENERLLRDKMQSIENTNKTEFQKVKDQITAMKREALTSVEANKMIQEVAGKKRTEILETQGKDLNELREQCKKAYRDLNAKIDKGKMVETISDAVSDRVKDKIFADMSTKVQDLVNTLVTQNSTSKAVHDRINTIIQAQVQQLLNNPSTYEKLVLESTGFAKLQSRIDGIEALMKDLVPIQKSNAESIESKVSDLDKKVTELNKTAGALLRNLSQRDGTGASAYESDILKSMASRIEELTKDLKVTKTQLKSSEALLDMRWRELERLLESRSSIDEEEHGRKRQRVDVGGPTTIIGDSEDLNKKLEVVEQKYTHILDFVQQFRTTVLNPQFPQRLQQAIANIESTLRNHELFIAHLVDPVAAEKAGPISVPTDPSGTSSSSNTQLLSPAMIPAIQDLVKKTVEHSTRPLLERIRTLEEELKKK